MNYLRQLSILLALCVAGDAVSVLIGGILPGNVLGMILLLLFLVFRLIKAPQVENVCDFFLKNMAVFFLPVSLGILELYRDLHNQLAAILAICILTTFLTAFATAGTVHLILNYQRKKQNTTREEEHIDA